MDKIYTVTGIAYNYSFKEKLVRCFGWYPTCKDAEDGIIKNNILDENGFYKWIVIEEFFSGLFNLAKERWYLYDNDKYIKIDKPEIFKPIISWGMG